MPPDAEQPPVGLIAAENFCTVMLRKTSTQVPRRTPTPTPTSTRTSTRTSMRTYARTLKQAPATNIHTVAMFGSKHSASLSKSEKVGDRSKIKLFRSNHNCRQHFAKLKFQEFDASSKSEMLHSERFRSSPSIVKEESVCEVYAPRTCICVVYAPRTCTT